MAELSDNELKKLLEAEGFNASKIDIDSIQYVPIHEFRVSNNERKLLLVKDLQSCIGLYAYGEGFAFAASIDPTDIKGNEFILSKGSPIYCTRVYDLYLAIKENINQIRGPLNIGVAIGLCPKDETWQHEHILNDSIKRLIRQLRIDGLVAHQTLNLLKHIFIIDGEKGTIITPSSQMHTEKKLFNCKEHPIGKTKI